MLKFRHTTLIIISGLIWFVIGVYLLQLGLNFLMGSVRSSVEGNTPLINFLTLYGGSAEGAMAILVVISLLIGYMKGRYVLGKSAIKGVRRILTFDDPTSILNIYSPKYYIILGSMIALGLSIKYLGFATDIRGVVDVIIGAALINGAMFYFRHVQSARVKVT